MLQNNISYYVQKLNVYLFLSIFISPTSYTIYTDFK